KQTVYLHHWTFASSTFAWPWMLAGLDGFAATGRARFAVLTALATAGTWIGSSPQMAYFGTGLAFLYALALAPELLRRSREHAAVGLCAIPIGVALAAPLLLPVHEMNALGPRGAGVTYRFAASWSWPDRSVWTAMLLPRAWGGRPDFRGPMNYWELQGYLGLLPMALLFATPLRQRRNWLLLAVALLGVWVSFGEHAWLDLHRFAIPLFIADVKVQCWDSPEVGPAAREARALEPFAETVPKAPLPRRVAAVLEWEEANAVLTRGWEGVTGYGPTPIERVLRLFEATWTGAIRPQKQINEDENFPRFRTDSPLTPLFAAPLLVADREASVPAIARDGAVRLYRLPALPRVFWTGAWQ